MISFLVAWHSGDVEKIIIEKSLTARLHGTEHTIRSGIYSNNMCILLECIDLPRYSAGLSYDLAFLW